jgi:hypothetical protein
MSSKGYTILGWLVWRIGSRVAKRKLAANRGKVGAVAAIVAVVAIGLALASGDDDDE